MLEFEKIYKDKFGKLSDAQKITSHVASRYGMIKHKPLAEQVQELTWLIGIKIEELNQKIKS
jgi:hypothetical protein